MARRRKTHARAGKLAPGLKVSIVAFSYAPRAGMPSLAREVDMAKAALLYADEVELISPSAAMITGLVGVASGQVGNLLDLMLSLDDTTALWLYPGLAQMPGWRDQLQRLGKMPRAERSAFRQVIWPH